MSNSRLCRTARLTGYILFCSAFQLIQPTTPLRADEGPSDDQESGPAVEFFLPLVSAAPGELLEVPFQVKSNVPLSMIAWSLEYDANVLEFLEPSLTPATKALMDSHATVESSFEWFEEAEEEEEEEESDEFDAAAGLSGAQLVPPIETTASGEVRIELEDGKFSVDLKVANIANVTRAEICLGESGENGPTVAVVEVFDGDGITVAGEEKIAEVDLEESDLLPIPEFGFDGTIEALIERMNSETAYVVVRTLSNPDGELRGQLAPKEEEAERWLQVSVVTDLLGREEFSIPADELFDVAILRFRVAEDAQEGSYDLEFSAPESATFDGNFHDGTDIVFNVVQPEGQAIDASNVVLGSSPANVNNGTVLLSIIGDIQILRGGDSNGDGEIDISDAINILQFLFSPGGLISCMAAADANRDGLVDISDAIQVLNYLFSPESAWSPAELTPSGPFPTGPECYSL